MREPKRTRVAWLAAAVVAVALALPAAAIAGYPFTLAVGEEKIFDGLTVKFNGVLAEYRCPRDLLCIWEGNAEAQIEAFLPGHERATLVLNTSPMFATSATYEGYKIQLLLLEPYPLSQSPPPPEAYVLTLLVSRAGPNPVEETTWGRIKALYGDED
jgi:hypothetical protein